MPIGYKYMNKILRYCVETTATNASGGQEVEKSKGKKIYAQLISLTEKDKIYYQRNHINIDVVVAIRENQEIMPGMFVYMDDITYKVLLMTEVHTTGHYTKIALTKEGEGGER